MERMTIITYSFQLFRTTFEIETCKSELTRERLSDVSILVIAGASNTTTGTNSFTSGEVSAIKEFMNINGGSLLVMSSSSSSSSNSNTSSSNSSSSNGSLSDQSSSAKQSNGSGSGNGIASVLQDDGITILGDSVVR